jgi:hypothetical protein
LILRPFRPLRLIKALISFIKKSRDELAAHFDIFFLNYSFSRSRKSKLDLTMIFLNGLAHTQHHYLLSSKFVDGNNPDWYSSNNKDPILECLKIYDQGFTELLKNLNDEDEIWILTGLSQEPFDEPINYWRFRDHNSILSEFINYDFKCNPRMTRDFELLFNNEKDAYRATEILNNIYVQAEEASYKAFIEIQNNDKSVFATFSYFGSCDCPILIYKNKKLNLKNAIDFIAVKNGGHSQKGWMISNSSINLSPNVVVPITNASSMMGL